MTSPSWRVAQIRADGENETLEIPPEGLLFGRSQESDVVLDSAHFPGVSSRHAHLFPDGDGLVLEDLGSRNGTLAQDKKIQRSELSHGAYFQLGRGGPQFVVYSYDRLDETVALPHRLARPSRERSLGSQTMFTLRHRLGIPQGGSVAQMVQRRGHRNLLVNMGILAVLIGGVTFIVLKWHESDSKALAALREETRDLATQLQEARRVVETQRQAAQEQESRYEEARQNWVAERDRLQENRDTLAESIGRLQREGRTGADELNRLKGRLEHTTKRLDLFDPVNLENERLEFVAGFESVVVLIEASLRWREEGGERLLYLDQDSPGIAIPNLEEEGELFERAATGSGFCISSDGWIITNAHVVLKEEKEDDTLEFVDDVILRSELDLWVTFSGERKRHPATIVEWRRDERQDLALLKIESFDSIPYLKAFATEGEKPILGSDVFLIGFPGGKSILQEGDRMLASTFRGIVSRTVDYYVQIDAAVHPGVSGGPVIDGQGRLVGVVTGMQTLDDMSNSSAIGYVIPIREVGSVWPPRSERE